ncbi:MAG: Gfo/Idh/MocA family oxidoreductase [Oscillospiraceae bacterium]|nr:Gfo/Idh/MocA family oxidoreductase [Oscillospiraceae bacterium]
MRKPWDKIRLGVVGVYRGSSMIKYCSHANNVELVAICDKWEERLELQKILHAGENIAYYTDFDEFLKHDMDAVVLANYANEHAPFAIKALRAGKHVLSEVLPVQTMKEAIELIEAVEETGLIYSYAENYCYMPAPAEMRRLYRAGKIGEFEYGEGEYVHNCEPIWPGITYGEEEHWRNNMYSTYYCTHSLGPIIHITGLRPVSVTGFESSKTTRNLRTGAKGGQFGVEIVELENGGIVKSLHFGLYKDSIWYSIYGSKGRMESAREDSKEGDIHTLYVNADEYDGQYGKEDLYRTHPATAEQSNVFGHGGSDFYTMWNFAEKILGNPRRRDHRRI